MALILERDGRACVWCGRDIDIGLVAATTEHVVPRIKGGPSWIENEVAACGRCNGQRGHLTPGEWLEECERRDRKGLYQMARQGKIKEFTGISDPYEAPTSPELRVDTENVEVDNCAHQVILKLEQMGLIAG